MLEKFGKIFIEENKKINLCGCKDEKTFYEKHILDSLKLLDFYGISNCKILDLGTGGGLPGIPLAIKNPDSEFILVDSTKKKIDKVKYFCDVLKIKNVFAIWARIEDKKFISRYNKSFDIVVCRAVSKLDILLEYAFPLIKNTGNIFLYKGPNYIDELENAQKIMKKYNFSLQNIWEYTLTTKEKRIILHFKK